MDVISQSSSTDFSYHFRLFVAGNERHSRTARINLSKLCESFLNDPYEIELVDVLESYETALAHSVFLTPVLIMVSPEPSIRIYGDLSDTEKVLEALRLEGDE